MLQIIYLFQVEYESPKGVAEGVKKAPQCGAGLSGFDIGHIAFFL